MELIQNGANCQFLVEANGNKHCFSYGSEVAAIIDGEYIEYEGNLFYSVTSCKHKSQFKRCFGIK